MADDAARDRQRVMIVDREVVGHAGHPRVHVGAAELLGADDLAGRRLDQRRTGQEYRPLVLDDDRLVGHRRHVRAARGARAHDHRDLRNAFRRHRRLVEEDAPEVIAVGEDVGLVGKVRPARVDQVDARQVVLARDVLRAQVLLDRHRVVGAALDGRVVADDHALASRDPTDAADDARRRDAIVVHVPRRELRELQEWRAGIEQHADTLARQELAAPGVALARDVASALLDGGDLGAKVVDERAHRIAIFREGVATPVDERFDRGHRQDATGLGWPGMSS